MHTAVLRWPSASAGVRGGTDIEVATGPVADEASMRLFLLGPVFAALLRQRGECALQASSVRLGDGAIGFLGWRGWGKSSTAAALYASGLPLVGDDLLGVRPEARGVSCAPAFPRLRLDLDTAARLNLLPAREECTEEYGAAVGDAPPDHSWFALGKASIPAERGFCADRLPLRGLFVLRRGSRAAVRKLPPGAGLVEVMRHSFAARWLSGDMLPRHLESSARVATGAPIFDLCLPDDITRLDSIASVVRDLVGPGLAA